MATATKSSPIFTTPSDTEIVMTGMKDGASQSFERLSAYLLKKLA